MRFAILIASVAFVSANATAQVADRLSRGTERNAIDRALNADASLTSARAAPTYRQSSDAEADRLRAEQAARDAAARRAPPSTSTLIDGPGGVQRLGSGAPPANAPQPPYAPPLPQP